MVRKIGQLSAMKVTKEAKPGYYADGGGLYLRVGPTGAKSWIFRYMLDGSRHDMGLGPVHTISLAEARAKAAEFRKLKHDGSDPLKVREAQLLAAKLESARTIRFRECADAFITAHRSGWKSGKHADQWQNTLATYVHPTLGDLPVNSIETGLVLKALEPIWHTKNETATRVRSRIENILDWATARGYRRGENPARWKGHLDKLLVSPSKIQKVRHHPALPYDSMGQFMAALRKRSGISARGLEFLILTALRTGEVAGARWDEIDWERKIWTVPAERMKMKREHRVPLSTAALAVLDSVKEGAPSEFIFPGVNPKKPLSNMAFLELLKDMPFSDRNGERITPHGFRSTFRDWASEQTHYPNEVAEMALAHIVKNKVEAAYRRGDLIEKRSLLMEDWAQYCAIENRNGDVVPIGRGKAAAAK
ncbi:MAG: tyrosine-type recombinase/integrase [Magnetospirillum sp.]|nr:tyrosine-type recombinase/integrase [Magnetospirillum sp.]